MSIKDLADAVLNRNQSGNQKETNPAKAGNFEETGMVSKFPFAREETRKLLLSKIKQACTGIDLDPNIILDSLSDTDMRDFVSGEVEPDTLKAYAESLSTGIRCGRVSLDDRNRILTHFNFTN